ncbi:MAG TPA: NAD(P)-binding domain-containing protein [Thermoanaerobaculia bacterium]|nr:NAD(P)-binding domain-containing protein [Thermoanaerobaculia bacterium]
MDSPAVVAIVGAGPIGLELAVALKEAGVDHLHFDAAQIGSTISWYPVDMMFHSRADRLAIAGVPLQIPDQQKPKRGEYLAYLRAVVQQFDLRIRSYERVERIDRLPGGGFELTTRSAGGEQRYRVAAVVLAVGAMHAPRLLGIPGEDSPHVSHYFRDPHDSFGMRLLIVGGRNSAVEAAIRCQRAGADVTLSYRRSDFDPQKVKWWLLPEIRGMIADGRVRFLPSTVPCEIRGRSVLIESTAGETLRELTADAVLILTGYRQDPTLFEQAGVDMQGEARQPVYDPATMETNVPGLFVAGTAIAGTPAGKVSVIVETCHVHVPRIVAALTGRRAEALSPGAEDD